MENTLWQSAPIISHFQFTSIGRDEGVREAATFEVEPGAVGELQERVVLRFYGVTRGLIRPDGSVAAATVEFELLTGPNRTTMGEVQHIRIRTDELGRGSYLSPNGINILVDGVTLGRLRPRQGDKRSAPRARPSVPNLTREFVVERMRAFYNPDGSPKPTSGTDQGEAPWATEPGMSPD
jgi:hypothetical protein